MAEVRDDLIASAVDELRQFVASHRGAKPRAGTRLATQLDTARRVVAAYDREPKRRPLAAGARR